jgi:hypothetical protein
LKDRLVAVVEQSTITEHDLIARFDIHKETTPGYKDKNYDEMRAVILEELCLDQLHSLMAHYTDASSLGITPERIQYFRERFPNLHCSDQAIEKAFVASVLRNQFSKQLASSKIKISQKDIAAASKNSMIWQSLNAKWSFDLAYSNKPLSIDSIHQFAENYTAYPVFKISPQILNKIDWTQLHTWQFFETDGEYVAFRLNHLETENLLPYSYAIKCTPEHSGVGKKPITLNISTQAETPPELFMIIEKLSVGERSKHLVSLGNENYYIELLSKDPISIAQIEEQLVSALRDHRMHQMLPEWHAELKNKYFIKVYYP